MTITIELPADVEALIEADAKAQGKDAAAVVADHVAAAYRTARRFDPDLVAALREGIAETEAGKDRPFAEFVAEQKVARAARAAQRDPK